MQMKKVRTQNIQNVYNSEKKKQHAGIQGKDMKIHQNIHTSQEVRAMIYFPLYLNCSLVAVPSCPHLKKKILKT